MSSKIVSVNPSTKVKLGEVSFSSEADIAKKVKNAHNALGVWGDLGVSGRVKYLRRVASGLGKRKKEFAELISKEMGMPISQSSHDVSDAIEYLEWYLDNGEKYLSPEVVYKDKEQINTVYREPVGVVAAITPWNFPASNFVWMCGQNLVVGNTVVYKTSEEIPLCGTLIEEVIAEAKLPEGVFSEVYGAGDVGSVLVNQDIDMICFTGSTATGKILYKTAADKFVKVFLELGGSAPGVVFKDADIDRVLETIYGNRFDNCGQICDGLKRLIVHKDKLGEVVEKLSKQLDGVVIGDASDKKTDIGPLVSQKQLTALAKQVNDAVRKGAKVEHQVDLPKDLGGYFYPPTILTGITPTMSVWNEEVFGPVLPIVSFKTDEEAVRLANDTKYGLGGYVFTEDKKKALKVASQIKTGMVLVNNSSYLVPESPFGGCKLSGMGREHGKYGFYDLTQVKVVSTER